MYNWKRTSMPFAYMFMWCQKYSQGANFNNKHIILQLNINAAPWIFDRSSLIDTKKLLHSITVVDAAAIIRSYDVFVDIFS